MSHTRIYVGRLNHRTRERDLEDLFSQYGKILSCDIKNGLGFGFVEFEDYRDADDAVRDLDGKEVDGSRITVEFSKSSRRGSSGGSSSSSNNRYGPPQRSEYRCIVDCLPRDMSWQDLKDHFRKVSDVIYADVWQDRGRGKGAVEFKSRDDMKKAIKELDATEVRGSKIYVEEDEDRYSRSYNRGSRYSRRRSYSRSRSPPRRRSRRSRSRSKSKSRSRSRSRSDSRDRKRGRGRSPSPTKSVSPPPKGSISPKPKKSPRYEISRSRSRSRDRSRGRSLSRSPPPHKRSRSPSPGRETKRQKVEEQEEPAD